MKKILLITFFNLFIMACYGQVLSWGKSLGSTGSDYGRSVFVDGSGGVYTVGSFQGTVDFDPGAGVANLTSAGGLDIFIQKVNSAGNFIYAKRIGSTGDDEANDVVVDVPGNIYITGYFNGTVDFDPNAGVSNLTSSGGTDAFILKLTSSANWAYSAKFGSTGADNGLTVACNSGSYCIGGTFSETVDFDPTAGVSNLVATGSTAGFIARFTSTSSFTFAAQFNNQGSTNGLAMDASGNIYSTGVLNIAGDFDPGAGTVLLNTAGSTDVFVSKLTASGAYVWAKLLGGTTGDGGIGIELDASGNIYTTGYFSGTADFDPGAGISNLISGGSNDIFVCKLNSSGDYVWAKSFSGTGDDRGMSIGIDASSNVYSVGYFRNTVDFDPGIGVANQISAGLTEGFLCKIDAAGNYVWSQKIGASGNDAVLGLAIDASTNLHFTGYYTGSVDVDPTAAVSNLNFSGGTEAMIVQWSPCAIPSAPENITAISDMTICGLSGSANLIGTGTGTLSWYSASSGGTYLGAGSTYSTGTISATTTYYLQDSSCIASPRTAITVNVNSLPLNQIVSSSNTIICEGGNATINVGSTETDVYYSLVNDANNLSVMGPLQGTGSALNFNISGITSTTTYHVTAIKPTNLNGALDLDGTNDYINLGASNRGITNAITVSAKVRTTVTGASQFIVDKYLSAGIGFYLLVDGSGYATFQGRDVAGAIKSSGFSTTMVADNQWHELTGVVRNTGWEIWVDGVLESSGAYSLGATGLGSSAVLYFGAYSTTYSPVDIDRVAIWNTALSNTTIAALNTSCLTGGESNLVAYYNFNENSGTSITDLSPSGISGTLVNMTAPACWITGGATQCESGCQLEMANTVTINVIATPSQPTISSSGSTTLCSGGSVTLTASAGTTYLWSTGATTASILVSTAGTYTVQVTNAAGCQSAASAGTTVIVGTPPAQPTVTAGGPTTFCTGGSVTLTASTGTSYLWSTGATTASISPSTSGTYTVQVTNASGCQSVASLGTTVTVNALPSQPSISAGGPTSFCTGGSVTLSASTGTSYLWSTGATTATITPTTSGTFTVQVTNTAGCQSVASAGTAVTVNSLPSQPTISAGGPTTFCAGGSVALTSTAGTTYLWSNGATTATISPTTAGNYTVQVTNAAGCLSTASLGTTVTVNALPSQPTITAGGPTTFCTGGSVTLTSSAGTSYFWSNGATATSTNITTSGTYSLQVTNAFGCLSIPSAGTTVTVNALPSQPTITAGGPTTFCSGGSVNLSASAGSSYVWSDGSLSPSINPSSTGTYTVQVTNSAGCQSIASAPTTVTVNSSPATPTISAGGSTTFCAGGSVALTSTTGTTYLWSNGATTATISPTTAGTYTVQITNAAGCQSAASTGTIVTVNALPVISQGTVTNPTSCVIDNGSIQVNGSGTGTLSWTGAASGSLTAVSLPTTIPALGDGAYFITFTNTSSCVSNTLNTTLSAPSAPAAPSISAGGSTTFCAGGSVSLTASTGSTYLWSTGETTSNIVATTAGNYTVTITDAAGCSSPSSASTVVTLIALPILSSGSITNPTSCTVSDGSIELLGTETGDLSWTGTNAGNMSGITLPVTVNGLANGNYTFTLTSLDGCESLPVSGTLTLPSAPSTPTITAGSSTTFCAGDMVSLTSTSGDSYLWSNGETTQSIDVDAAGTYTVTITDLAGCTSPTSAGTNVIVNAIPSATTTVSGITISATTAGVSYQWIDCGNSNQPIAGATSQSYTPTVNGNYAVIVSQNNCSDTSACTSITTVGLNELQLASNITLVPNPGTDWVTIVTNEQVERAMVYAANGAFIEQHTSTTFNIEGYAPGVYLIQVTTSSKQEVIRLVKQ